MALKEYCSSCGDATEFTLTRPKFCAGCGTPFSGAKIASKPISSISSDKVRPNRLKPRIQRDVEDTNVEPEDQIETEIDEIPEIKELKVKFSASRYKETIGDIINTPQVGGSRPLQPDQDRETVLANFRRDAGGNRSVIEI